VQLGRLLMRRDYRRFWQPPPPLPPGTAYTDGMAGLVALLALVLLLLVLTLGTPGRGLTPLGSDRCVGAAARVTAAAPDTCAPTPTQQVAL